MNPRIFLRFLRSIAFLISTVPLLRRPRSTIILLCIIWSWRLHKLPRSIVKNKPFRILKTIRGPHRAWWSWRRHERRRSCGFAIAAMQAVELKWLKVNKVNKWFHSSRVKFPFVKMSASWFLVSMYLIWILGSRLIRSNNQSRATLWVLETCLIVGLLPFIIILITASLSSNTYNKASRLADWTFEGTESMSWITSILL